MTLNIFSYKEMFGSVTKKHTHVQINTVIMMMVDLTVLTILGSVQSIANKQLGFAASVRKVIQLLVEATCAKSVLRTQMAGLV